MSDLFKEHLKQIEQLQGSTLQILMQAFNELGEIESNFTNIDTSSVSSTKQLKHLILSTLRTSIQYVNGPNFRQACICCKAIRILAILKQHIAYNYITEKERVELLGEAIIEHKIDKKYTGDFYGATQALKNVILKFISSQALRKQFQISGFCIQFLQNEKKYLEANFPDNAEIIMPQWIKDFTEQELDDFSSQVVQLLGKNDYEAFNKYVKEK